VPLKSLILGKISINVLAKKENMFSFLSVTLQPAGFPFLILRKIFECFVVVKIPFWPVINSIASRLVAKPFIPVVFEPKFKIIFLLG
jgi:hypothetical protein